MVSRLVSVIDLGRSESDAAVYRLVTCLDRVYSCSSKSSVSTFSFSKDLSYVVIPLPQIISILVSSLGFKNIDIVLFGWY